MVKTPPKIDEDTHQSERDSPSNDPRNDRYKEYKGMIGFKRGVTQYILPPKYICAF